MRERDERLARLVRERMRDLGLTIQGLVDAAGITRQGLAPLINGEVRAYQDRLKFPVCRELHWTPDSIDRILAGLDPVENGGPAADETLSPSEVERVRTFLDETLQPGLDRLEGIAERAQAVLGEVADVAHRLSQVEQRLAQLERNQSHRESQ